MIRKMKRHRLLLYLSFVAFCLLIAGSFLIHTQCLKPSVSYYKILEDHIRDRRVEDRSKYILLYTNFFDVKNWKLSAETVGPDYFRSLQCPVTDCVLTNNRELLSTITDYDALVFHIAEPWAYSLFEKVPKLRSPHQIYVAANMESPAHTKHLLGGDRDFFNWTMTYRLDSDVVWNYNNFVDAETEVVVGPSERPQWRNDHEEYYNETVLELVLEKTKMGVQFVSHCGTISKRDDLVREIQKLTDVDIYGKCGNME